MILVFWIVVLVITVAFYLREVYSKFSRYGVAHFKPIPMLGNIEGMMIHKRHIGEDVKVLYDAFPNERFMGRFEMLRPIVVLRDLELIKQVTVKNFEHFLDHRSMVDGTVDPFFGRNLFSLKGQEWKDMRSTLSPAFTSSKIRAMVPFMVDANDLMIRMLKKKIEASESGYIDIETKDLFTRYANDVIASCAFGVKVDSHTEPRNEFYLHGREAANFGFRKIFCYLGYCSFPSIMKKLNFKFIAENSSNFFKDLFLTEMTERTTKNIVRPDMIHLLLEANKGKLKHEEVSQIQDVGFSTVEESDFGKTAVNKSWSDDDLVAQAVLFFLAGFETISSAMCFLLHELALNPDIQERLVEEIRQNEAINGGKFDYSSIQNLKYLDMVVSELLRLWPPGVGLDRMCVKDFNLGKPNDKAKRDYIVRKGELVLVPVWSLHRNPEYYPNPDKFDPERFLDENKAKLNPFAYMPFGNGPRNCIGSRFALCEVKVMAYHLLQQVEVSPCVKTRVPTKLSPNTFLLAIEGGHWVRFRLRR